MKYYSFIFFQRRSIFIVTIIGALGSVICAGDLAVIAQSSVRDETLRDDNLRVEKIAEGFEFPTSMAFLGPDDILVTEKDSGEVKRVKDGQTFPEPLLVLNVTKEGRNIERGLLGIAISNATVGRTYVFLYYTEADSAKGETPVGNRLYRYEFLNDKLINPKLMIDLPATPGPSHNGGKVTVGPDNNIYTVIGIVGTASGQRENLYRTKAENFKIDSIDPDGRSGVLRIGQDGKLVGQGILGEEHPLNMYYAYGIRNSFGIAFDPLTGHLWETENGEGRDDEINLVYPGFNSGWQVLMGFMEENRQQLDLVNFDGRGHYSDPEFVWNETIAPTAIEFLNSDKLGSMYEGDMFVGDFKTGRIYNFSLNFARDGLELIGDLSDKYANNEAEQQQIIFGEGFGGVNDIKVGLTDGYLYVLSWADGAIYRIMPKANATGIN